VLGGTGRRIRKGIADHGAAGRGEYSVTLERLTRYTLGHKMLVAAVWIGVGVLLALAFPQLETVVRQQSVDPIPAGVPSFQALDRMGQAFGETGAKTTVVIAMENHAGLTDQTRAQYNALVQQLRANTKDVQSVHDIEQPVPGATSPRIDAVQATDTHGHQLFPHRPSTGPVASCQQDRR